VAGSLRSHRVIEVLTRLISQHGAPHYLRSDNGPEFVSHAILEWLANERIETALIDPGKDCDQKCNSRGMLVDRMGNSDRIVIAAGCCFRCSWSSL
jgi:hypothetical protein